MSIGNNIKKYRKEVSLTQDDLAQKIGISKSFMSKIEIDNKMPSIEVMFKISNELKIPYLDLIEGTEYENSIVNKVIKDITLFTTDELLAEIKRRIDGE